MLSPVAKLKVFICIWHDSLKINM